MAIAHRADRGPVRRLPIRRLLRTALRELMDGLALAGSAGFCPVSAHAAREAYLTAPRVDEPELTPAQEEVLLLETLWRL